MGHINLSMKDYYQSQCYCEYNFNRLWKCNSIKYWRHYDIVYWMVESHNWKT